MQYGHLEVNNPSHAWTLRPFEVNRLPTTPWFLLQLTGLDQIGPVWTSSD